MNGPRSLVLAFRLVFGTPLIFIAGRNRRSLQCSINVKEKVLDAIVINCTRLTVVPEYQIV